MGAGALAKLKVESFDYKDFMARRRGGSLLAYRKGQIVYAQGDPPNSFFYIIRGAVKITIYSETGREAIIGTLSAGDFFGEGCLDGRLLRTSTIICTSDCELARFPPAAIRMALNEDQAFTRIFLAFILGRNEQLKAHLVDHWFNSSEKRLARILIILANAASEEEIEFIKIAIDQETLAKMVGTTRSRINYFMNKFRALGYVDYNGDISVHRSLTNVLLQERRPQSRISKRA